MTLTRIPRNKFFYFGEFILHLSMPKKKALQKRQKKTIAFLEIMIEKLIEEKRVLIEQPLSIMAMEIKKSFHIEKILEESLIKIPA